jgi:hypothetical protein
MVDVIPGCQAVELQRAGAGFVLPVIQEAEEDGSGDAAAGGADRLFSSP